jgi:RNA polymerase sigma-70 factor (ECF subfamily)
MQAAVQYIMGHELDDQLAVAMRRGYVAAYRWLRQPDQAHDACQEAAARVLAHRERFDASRPLYPWFYRILKNHCFDRLKARKLYAAADREFEDGAATVEQQVLHHEQHAAVRRAIAALDAPLAEVIELRHFQDASYEEIADILDLPAGTVMSRLYRARKSLREILQRDVGWSGGGAPDVVASGGTS